MGAACAIAASASVFDAIKIFWVACSVFGTWWGDVKTVCTDAGRASQRPPFFKIAQASCGVPIGATVGPDAITAKSSPITSDKIKATTGAGAAASTMPPPFKRDRLCLIRFICRISSPLANSKAFTAILSSRLMPALGAGKRAEPPPEISATTVSWAPAFCNIAST